MLCMLRARQGDSLNSLLPEAFALVREAAKRRSASASLTCRSSGGIAIHYRCIAELETGEGKTLVSTMPAFLNALTGKGVHIVTVNDYLARRDAEWMGPIYHDAGFDRRLHSDRPDRPDPPRSLCLRYHLRNGQGAGFRLPPRRAQAAAAWRRRRTARRSSRSFWVRAAHVESQMPVQRTHHFAIVDEADSILIDEARTPLIIGANNQPTQEEAAAYYGADQLAATLVRVKDYKYDPLERKAELSAAGRRKVQAVAANPAFVSLTVDGLYEYVERSLRAQIAYLKDRDYVAVDGEIVIVDEFTGRMMPGRQWQDGLHQAIQAKETARDHPRNDHGRAGDGARLLQTLQQARGHDRNGILRCRRAAPDLQSRRLQGSHQSCRASESGCPIGSSRPSMKASRRLPTRSSNGTSKACRCWSARGRSRSPSG